MASAPHDWTRSEGHTKTGAESDSEKHDYAARVQQRTSRHRGFSHRMSPVRYCRKWIRLQTILRITNRRTGYYRGCHRNMSSTIPVKGHARRVGR